MLLEPVFCHIGLKILGLIPEGREPSTHSEDLNFKKVAREPNRFKSVFLFENSAPEMNTTGHLTRTTL
jgi:hypothetical protein